MVLYCSFSAIWGDLHIENILRVHLLFLFSLVSHTLFPCYIHFVQNDKYPAPTHNW